MYSVFVYACVLFVLAEVTRKLEHCMSASQENEEISLSVAEPTSSASGTTSSTSVSASSPPRKRRILFASYEKHLVSDASATSATTTQSAAATVLMYVDALPSLMVQARQSKNPWLLFKSDKRFVLLHPLLERLLCVLATSAPVERVFSHGGLFMRPHRARLGNEMLSALVFSKCNKHLKTV